MADSRATPIRSPFAALRPFTLQAPVAKSAAEEHCEICDEPIGPEHRHLLDLGPGQVLCACRACAILFASSAAGGGARKLIPNRCLRLTDFIMTDALWDSLRIPVNMAFFNESTPAKRVLAHYPGPMGSTESLLTLETWDTLVEHNPLLATMEADVEALLVNRVGPARDYFLAPIDECFRLVGLIRLQWRGLGGGREVWPAIAGFFAGLTERARNGGGIHA